MLGQNLGGRRQYLIEEYRVSAVTLASNAPLKDRPDIVWSAAGFGVTKKHEDNEAFPEVVAELKGVGEILHGEIKLDQQFTEASMGATPLSAGQTHAYTLKLKADQYLGGVVTQPVAAVLQINFPE
jgi:hypothetical protein